MTATDYRNAGYKVSMQIDQSFIDRAEATAMQSYVLPILPNATTADDDVKKAVMAIAFVLMCNDNTFVTRAGAKGKNTPINSTDKQPEQILQSNADECVRLINVLRGKAGAVADAKVYDVAKFFFKSNYFYIND